MTVHAQLCMYFQFGSSNLVVLVQQYRSCRLYKAELHTQGWNPYLHQSQHRDSALGPDIAAVLGDNTCSIKKFPSTRYIEHDCGYTESDSVLYFLNRY